MADTYESEQSDLDPHRAEEERLARQEAEARLRSRGIVVFEQDEDVEVADLLDAIELFEAAVEARGGDLFVNRIGSPQPESPEFVPPIRREGESAASYRVRVSRATDRLRRM
jgi:hypothetical protein